jgi:hypothetical protein
LDTQGGLAGFDVENNLQRLWSIEAPIALGACVSEDGHLLVATRNGELLRVAFANGQKKTLVHLPQRLAWVPPHLISNRACTVKVQERSNVWRCCLAGLRSPCPGRTIRQQYNFIRGRWAAKKRTGRLRRLNLRQDPDETRRRPSAASEHEK